MRFLKRVGERGTVTLPAELREVLGVSEGDIVEFELLGVVKRSDSPGPVKLEGKALTPATEESKATTSQARPQPADQS